MSLPSFKWPEKPDKQEKKVYHLPDSIDRQELRAACLDLAVKSIGEQNTLGFSKELPYIKRAIVFEKFILTGEYEM